MTTNVGGESWKISIDDCGDEMELFETQRHSELATCVTIIATMTEQAVAQRVFPLGLLSCLC